jgi:hypothetical protein
MDLYFRDVNSLFPILRDASGPREMAILKAMVLVMAPYPHVEERLVSFVFSVSNSSD